MSHAADSDERVDSSSETVAEMIVPEERTTLTGVDTSRVFGSVIRSRSSDWISTCSRPRSETRPK